ncbi:hypothetical protein P8452_67124 [Trifolium repens]|nr:hypothetical protein P8452_67124 [Trifolium repens]
MVARHHRQFVGVSPTWTCFSRFRRRFAVLPSSCSVFRPPCIYVFRSCCSSTVFRFVLIRSGFHFSVFWCRSTVFIFLLVYGAMLFSLCFLCFRLVPCFFVFFFLVSGGFGGGSAGGAVFPVGVVVFSADPVACVVMVLLRSGSMAWWWPELLKWWWVIGVENSF